MSWLPFQRCRPLESWYLITKSFDIPLVWRSFLVFAQPFSLPLFKPPTCLEFPITYSGACRTPPCAPVRADMQWQLRSTKKNGNPYHIVFIFDGLLDYILIDNWHIMIVSPGVSSIHPKVVFSETLYLSRPTWKNISEKHVPNENWCSPSIRNMNILSLPMSPAN